VEDQAGNFDQVTRTVTIIDTTPPVISIRGAPSIRHEAATPYTDGGATAADSKTRMVTVADTIKPVRGKNGKLKMGAEFFRWV